MRDFSGEALLGTSAFTLRVFGADSGYLYLFANGSDASYAILRVTPDGTTEQILFTATGGSASGKITQALLAENGVIYFSTEDGFYALPASGGQPRRLTANYTSVPFYLWEGELFFIDAQANLCAVQTNGGGAKEAGGRLRPLPTGRVRRDCLLHIGGLRRFRVKRDLCA